MKKHLRKLAALCIEAQTIGEKAAIANEAKKLLATAPSFKNYAHFKRWSGLSYFASVDSSSKIVKGRKEKVNTLILYLAASKNAGIDLCRFASEDCRNLCLVKSGHALLESGLDAEKQTIAIARIIKTWIMVFREDIARDVLAFEIVSKEKSANKKGFEFAVRLNGTSDIDHSATINAFPLIQFYDYSKRPLQDDLPKNYSLTVSYANFAPFRVEQYRKAIAKGLNIAVAVTENAFKKAIESLPFVFNADRDDLRYKDLEKGQLALLKIKTTANSRKNGVDNPFVLDFKEIKKLAKVAGIK